MKHILKIDRRYYLAIRKGLKTFELRKNDRNYKVGDTIHFISIKGGEFSKKYNEYKITYILSNVEKYGLNKDYCILALQKEE